MTIIQSTLPPETTLYRYMDLTKFISLLHSKSIYLSQMTSFDDLLEGSLTAQSYINNSNDAPILDLFNLTWGGGINETSEERKERKLKIDESKSDIHKRTFNTPFGKFLSEDINEKLYQCKEHIYVSCWHKSEYESAAMWKLFGAGNSVCIKTSVSKILNGNIPKETVVRLDEVKYINHSIQNTHTNSLQPFISKSLAYEFEKEVRLIGYNPDEDINNSSEGFKEIKYNLNNLIEQLIISPNSPPWFKEQVTTLCCTYNLTNLSIVESELSRKPITDIYTAMNLIEKNKEC